MNAPKISIMIPTYNRAVMLVEAIESCLAQDYANLEVVISDNASPDDTPNVVQPYLKDARVRYFRQSPGIPPADNWRKLVYEYAQGDYGQLLCDDDLLTDTQYLSKVAALITETDVQAVFSRFLYKDDGTGKQRVRDLLMPRVVTPAMWIKTLGTWRSGSWVFPDMPTVYRLAQARSLKVYSPGVPGLDFELILRFMLAGSTGYLAETYCTAREHQGNASKTVDTAEAFLEAVKMFQRFYEQGVATGLPERKLEGAKRRLMVLFLRIFALRAWLGARGNGPRSLSSFYSRVRELDALVAKLVFLDVRTLGKILLFNHSQTYKKVGQWINRRDYPTPSESNDIGRTS